MTPRDPARDRLADDLARATLKDLRSQMEALRERGMWPVSKIVAERDAVAARVADLETTLRTIYETADWYAKNDARLAHEVDHALCVEIVSYAESALADTGEATDCEHKWDGGPGEHECVKCGIARAEAGS